MRWILLLLLVPSLASAQAITSGWGTFQSGPRILGEPAFAFEIDALSQDEVSRPGWPVTTTRASTRMCWTGTAWQTVAAGVPCISVWGLASFGAGTNYWVNSASVALWLKRGTPVDLGSDTWSDDDPAALEGWQVASIARTAGEAWTLTCEMRAGTLSSAHLFADGSTTGCLITGLTTEWTRRSCTNTSPTTSSQSAVVYIGNTTPATTGSIGVRQCQLEKSATPGPRHDCGGAACSWEADHHEAAGVAATLPTTTGDLRFRFVTPPAFTLAAHPILDTRAATGDSGLTVYLTGTGALVARPGNAVEGAVTVFGGPALAAATEYEGRLSYSGGTYTFFVNGVQVGSGTAPVIDAHHTLRLGVGRVAAQTLNGYVRLIRWSE